MCTEKKFGYFYKGELWGFVMPFTPEDHLVISISGTADAASTAKTDVTSENAFFQENLLFQFCKVVYESARGQLYNNVSVFLY